MQLLMKSFNLCILSMLGKNSILLWTSVIHMKMDFFYRGILHDYEVGTKFLSRRPVSVFLGSTKPNLYWILFLFLI